jgi:hypothetical protein
MQLDVDVHVSDAVVLRLDVVLEDDDEAVCVGAKAARLALTSSEPGPGFG